MKENPVRDAKVAAAVSAIETMGGPLIAAQKIRELTGKPCTRDRVQKWKTNGIAPPWHPIVHKITGIPLNSLDPQIYPGYIFLA
jgi:hypothetical protein